MTRKEIIGAATLYLGDCLEILPTFQKVDAVITDPPYGGRTHAGARTDGGKTVLLDFASINDETFQRFCRMAVESANRWVIMTCEWRHAAKAEDVGLPVIRLGVWVKPNGMPQMTGDRPAMGWEAVLIMHREGKKRWNGGGNHAVWRFNKENGEHPTTKPLGLINKWLEQFTDRGELICDPFMGSGTTGVACMNLGRKFIGIEIEPKYFDIACERIDNAQRQQRMFA